MGIKKSTWWLVIALMLVGGVVAAEGLDVTLIAPTILFDDGMGTTQEFGSDDMQTVLNTFKNDLENDPDLQNFQNQQQLALAFANAGAAATHLATQRSFSDYRVFALVLGGGLAVAAPAPSPQSLEEAGTTFEDEGDVYFGAAIQPITASLGINLSPLINRVRINGKFGYFSAEAGEIVEDISFSSMTVGGGVDYQLLRSRSIALGIFKWRGLTIGTGVNYQTNEAKLSVEVQDSDFSQTVTYNDLGISNPSGPDTDPVGDLTIAPSIIASVQSESWSIPLEVSTGLRVLYLFDFNVGAGVDFTMGSSEVVFGSESVIGFDPDAAADPYVDLISTGSANFGVVTEGEPQFVRPRLTAGVGLNLGPIKLDVPVMYYLDDDGPTAMAGVNVGLVW